MPGVLLHGTRSSYQNHGCRCDDCTAAQTAYNRKRVDPAVEAARSRRRYAADPATTKARVGRYRQTDAGRLVQMGVNHRRRSVPMSEEAKRYAAMLHQDPCAYCGSPAGEIDHITAVATTGDGEWNNLTAACRTCNAHKATKPLLAFLMGGN